MAYHYLVAVSGVVLLLTLWAGFTLAVERTRRGGEEGECEDLKTTGCAACGPGGPCEVNSSSAEEVFP